MLYLLFVPKRRHGQQQFNETSVIMYFCLCGKRLKYKQKKRFEFYTKSFYILLLTDTR